MHQHAQLNPFPAGYFILAIHCHLILQNQLHYYWQLESVLWHSMHTGYRPKKSQYYAYATIQFNDNINKV